jgi:hypothetical protein
MLSLQMDNIPMRASRSDTSHFVLLDRPPCAAPLSAKCNTGVQHRHRKHRQKDHRPLQNHERHLVIGNRTIETLVQLGNSVHRTDEYEHNSRGERILEVCKLFRVPQLGESRFLGALTRLAQAVCEFQPQAHEDEQRDDLEHDTGKHNGPSCVASGVIAGCSCEPATGALEDERDEVACDEGDCVGARPETGYLLAVYDDDAGEAEVKGAGEACRGDCERNEISMRVVRTLFSESDGAQI